MTTTRTLSLNPAFLGSDRSTVGKSVRNKPANRPLLIAAVLFLAVLIADAMLIAMAAPSMADIGSLYVTVT
jgi:hypothetical protein